MRIFQVLFVVWVAASITALFFFIPRPNTLFDDGRLYQAAKTRLFDQKISAIAQAHLGKDIAHTVIHFSSAAHCLCEPIARRHIQSVKKVISTSGGTSVDVTLHNHSDWLDVIPATPAVAVFDSQGNLSYLGPYSTGTGCFTSNGIVENYINKQSMIGSTVLSDAEGCYCRTASSRQHLNKAI